jgi:hypothetical protein
MKPLTKAERSDRNRKAIAGVRKQLASTKTVVLDGVSYAPDDIVKALQGSIDAADATIAVTAQFHKTVDAERAANATADTVYAGLKTYVTSQYKASPDTMADFGITLPSRRRCSSAVRRATPSTGRASARPRRATSSRPALADRAG